MLGERTNSTTTDEKGERLIDEGIDIEDPPEEIKKPGEIKNEVIQIPNETKSPPKVTPRQLDDPKPHGPEPESPAPDDKDSALDTYNDAMSRFAAVITIVLVFLHLTLGTIGFSFLMDWTLLDAFYFSVVTATTVGYGDLVPDDTPFHMVIGVLYIWLSLSVITAGLGLFANKTIAAAISDVGAKKKKDSDGDGDAGLDDEGKGRGEIETTMKYGGDGCGRFLGGVKDSRSYCLLDPKTDDHSMVLKMQLAQRCAGMITLFCFGVGSMWHLEPTWSLMESIFFITVTLSSVGYGDHNEVPKTPTTRLFMSIYILIGVAATSVIAGGTVEMVFDYIHKKRQAEFIRRKLTTKRVTQMDEDDDGQVTEMEFLLFMLRQTGLVGGDDLELLRSQFKKLDVSGDGLLSATDFSFDVEVDQYHRATGCSP